MQPLESGLILSSPTVGASLHSHRLLLSFPSPPSPPKAPLTNPIRCTSGSLFLVLPLSLFPNIVSFLVLFLYFQLFPHRTHHPCSMISRQPHFGKGRKKGVGGSRRMFRTSPLLSFHKHVFAAFLFLFLFFFVDFLLFLFSSFAPLLADGSTSFPPHTQADITWPIRNIRLPWDRMRHMGRPALGGASAVFFLFSSCFSLSHFYQSIILFLFLSVKSRTFSFILFVFSFSLFFFSSITCAPHFTKSLFSPIHAPARLYAPIFFSLLRT